MKKREALLIKLFIASIVFIVLHNLVYAVFKFEEPVFFLLGLASILGTFISLIYNIFMWVKNLFSKN